MPQPTWRILAASPRLVACRNWLVRSASWRASVCCTSARTRSRFAIACQGQDGASDNRCSTRMLPQSPLTCTLQPFTPISCTAPTHKRTHTL